MMEWSKGCGQRGVVKGVWSKGWSCDGVVARKGITKVPMYEKCVTKCCLSILNWCNAFSATSTR